MNTYLDTSALAKWYLNEPESDAFCEWVVQQDQLRISTLTLVEARCMLARRRRTGELDAALEQEVYAAIENDVASGILLLERVDDDHLLNARMLLERLGTIALRTLDAIHLSIAQSSGCEVLVSYDRVLLEAGRRLEMQCLQPA